MKVEEVSRCQIQDWYPKFKSLSIRTIIHELPEPFVEYLNDPGTLILPDSVTEDDAFPNRVHKPEDEDDFQVQEGSDEEDESEQPSTPPPSFPELELKIKESIESLGGAVFPKLNWSAPKDAAWISCSGNLKCSTFSEIVLLLKSSDSLVHDLDHAYDSCDDKTAARPQKFFLALRKWYNSLRPEMEFRCFVRDRILIGISQREVTGFYPSLFARKDELSTMIQDFYQQKLGDKFESESYTFDVYITGDNRVKLLDFNPWCGSTLPLLFSWEELEEISRDDEEVPEFRIVGNQCGVRPGMKTAVPYDYLDTSPGSGWDQFLNQANEELKKQSISGEAGA
ncbi:OLC1v1003286C1 [Oldenlandia corymbosa var. corymbosa]|uniref:OLC1v1003286C1 n=1 Tax=Oldenlandia corymbosa var. corymbosa TaxID=529605 RepID=A0AAV1DCP6_OLDCO|nr:OLC1v1003286C1 [Oldenlandia corymbosa var. corymbosa]